MKIMVSACLLGINCKYNGKNNKNEKVLRYIQGHEVIAVCPETAGGLTTPRIPSEIVDGVVTNKEGSIVDREFRIGAEIECRKAIQESVDLVILQSRSPSCGAKQIYDGSFSGKLIDGMGIFAQRLSEHGFQILDAEDL